MQQRRRPAGTAGNPPRTRKPWTATRKSWAATRAAAASGVLLVGGSAIAGCAQQADAAASIQLGTAYVAVPTSGDITEAYLVIRNNGPADRLVSARTSEGGRVTFREPARAGTSAMRTVPDIAIPADSLLRLSPTSSHLLIVGAAPLKGGTQITLTLVFAKGGTMSVAAEVTNPESGGSSYFLN
jgi:periplasmic copper chaperone A